MARFQNKYYKLAAFSSAQNKTKGVLILVNRKLNLTIEHLGSDEKGRFVFIRCKIYNNRLALVSIYGPNECIPYTVKINSVKKRRTCWQKITRIKTENSVDLHFLLYHKRTIRYAEISKKI